MAKGQHLQNQLCIEKGNIYKVYISYLVMSSKLSVLTKFYVSYVESRVSLTVLRHLCIAKGQSDSFMSLMYSQRSALTVLRHLCIALTVLQPLCIAKGQP